MNILYLSSTRFPTERAHGAQIAHMCNAFTEDGTEVTLLAPKRKDQVAEGPFAYYGVPQSFTLKHVSGAPWGVSTKFGFFSNLLIYTLKACLLTLKQKWNIVYSRDEFVLLPISYLIPKEKIIWESHEAKYNLAVRNLLKRGVKCVVISEGIKEFYISKGVPEEQVHVAHDAVDDSFFGEVETKEEARERLGIKSDKLVAMYIGGLDTWKGVATFFQASRHNEDVLFAVIGGREEEVQRYQNQYPNVLFLGARPYSELKDNQQAADVLVVPNTAKNDLSAKYTSPLKLFAHLTSRVPLVVSDIPSMRSVVSEEQVTFFAADDPDDLATKIRHLFVDQTSAKVRAEHAVQLAWQYTWEKRAEKILTAVTSLEK